MFLYLIAYCSVFQCEMTFEFKVPNLFCQSAFSNAKQDKIIVLCISLAFFHSNDSFFLINGYKYTGKIIRILKEIISIYYILRSAS